MRYLTELSLEAFIEAARNVPYQQISSELFPGIDLWIRRDDLIDPLISGNKAYKLIYNLLEARAQGKDTIVTCGGAWSNHIHATAAAGARFDFHTIGIIRGERPPALSAMLQDAERFGMDLHFVSRVAYRGRNDMDFLAKVGLACENFWFIPEGGANELGAKGINILADVICETSPKQFDECWVASGTGVTLGALAVGLPDRVKLTGVPVLQGEKSIRKSAERWACAKGRERHFDLVENAHHGGYGKCSLTLLSAQRKCEALGNLGLEHVYTAKLFCAAAHFAAPIDGNKLVRKNAAPKRILLLHTGGLQGRRGLAG
ncbi:1-aminocyclopropane-1-carboxylate deaminase/D-cysteine desulfhydrase [Microbulbifer pacificus]|uniref:Pyridoxal-phosphate dependent enzyme n=1 Tax=Microbulbifer pacificus TaxID=407164 RepID=A0AAU0MY44_9GAMM|nr:pyridoxal-phosphate dependent enzyme [Microbulbifer pacificus]WOX05438.1 pyridoxal-phosphate dependent enzyme [Microbulbifer pacificus]